jgi:anti-sigma factor RsiW
MNCQQVVSLLARRADDADGLDAAVRAEVDAHVAGCRACQRDLGAQRDVAAWLRSRPADRLSSQFASRLGARLDEASGWFGIADWRVWTLRLAPVAAALALATYLGLGASSQTAVTLDDWTAGTADESAVSVLLEPDVSADAVVETMLTGEPLVAAGDTGDAR